MAEYILKKGVIEYQILGGELSLEEGRAVDAGTIELSLDALNVIISGDEISIIQRPTDGSADTTIFAGRVVRPMSGQGVLQVDVESYSAILNNVHAAEIYNNKSPEYIANDLVTNYTDLIYTSTASSGITITQFVVNDETIGEAIKRLVDLLGEWEVRGDFNKNFYFEPNTISASGKTLTVGVDCTTSDIWDSNPDKVINKIILIGSNQTFNTFQDSFTAVGGETIKALSYLPVSNFHVTDDGVEMLGSISTTVSNPDYTIDKDNLLLTFSTALTAGHTIVVNYSYEIPIKITARGPEDSITQHGEREEKITNTTIKTMGDARKFIESYFVQRAYPTLSNTIQVADDYTITQGQTIIVVDEFEGVNEELLVQAKKYDFSSGLLGLVVGTKPFTNYNLQKQIEERLSILEQSTNNSNKIQQYNTVQENLSVLLNNTVYNYEIAVYDSFILDIGETNVDFIGDRREGDDFEQSEILTNLWTTTAGVTIDTQRMKLDSSISDQSAIYTSGSSFSILNGKIKIGIQKNSATGTETLMFRYVDSNNYCSIIFDFLLETITLTETSAGVINILATANTSFSAMGDQFVLRYSNSLITLTDSNATLINYIMHSNSFIEVFSDTDFIDSASTATVDILNGQVSF